MAWMKLLGCWIVAAAIVAAVSAPDCQSIAPTQKTLTDVHTTNITVPGNPFGVVYARNDIVFVSYGNATAGGGYLGVLNTSTFTPTLIQVIKLPATSYETIYVAEGLAITREKKTVYVCVGEGAVAIDVEKAIAGEADSIAGILTGTVGTSSIEATLSPDDKYLFVSQEDGNKATGARGVIEVFKVDRASNGSISSTYIGATIPLGISVVGSALSHDGSKLYATSEQIAINNTQGTLNVLDVATLQTNPSEALLASVDAGCSPVRVIVSHDGKHVWATARESNMLLAFDAAKLESNSSNALLASVQVGTSPVGLTFVNHGKHIITADSNRFGYPNATSGLTVIDAEAALKGEQGFSRIPTGLFPRQFGASPDGKTLLVTVYGSEAVQAVNVGQIACD